MAGPDFSHEAEFMRQHSGSVAGADEAGCGPLAGPVVAAAVILNPERIPAGLDDSKQLSAKIRQALFAEVMASAIATSICVLPPQVIDGINIRSASLLAMKQAVIGLSAKPAFVFVDGRNIPPGLLCPCRAIIGGDGISASIAAASILAKVTRDALMLRLNALAPQYGFAHHMGYGTKAHLAALALHGPSPWHRMTFSPLRQKTAPT